MSKNNKVDKAIDGTVEALTKPVMPQANEIRPNVVKSKAELKLEKLIAEAGKTAPVITDVRDMEFRPDLKLPECFKRGEYGKQYWYKWVGTADSGIDMIDQHRRTYEIVTRVNHPDIPSDVFHENGAIMKSNMILMFQAMQYKQDYDKYIQEKYESRQAKDIEALKARHDGSLATVDLDVDVGSYGPVNRINGNLAQVEIEQGAYD